jgi:hypothetical protein
MANLTTQDFSLREMFNKLRGLERKQESVSKALVVGSSDNLVVKNNLEVLTDATILGDLGVTGTITGSITGNASTLDGLDSTQFLRSDQSDTFAGILTFEDTTPLLSFTETDATADNQRWNLGPSGGSFRLQALTDAGAGSGDYFQINRSGNSITGFGLYGAGTLRTFLSTTARSVLFSGGAGSVGTDTAHSFSLKTNNIDRLTIDSSGNTAVTGNLTAPNYITGDVVDRVKYGVWDNADTWGIGMTTPVTYGHLTNYAMTFQMDPAAGRGWWWGVNTDALSAGSMSLTNDGKLHVEDSITVGPNNLPVGPNLPKSRNFTANGNLLVTDVGQHVNITSAATLVIPNSTFAEGDIITLVNTSGAARTITCSTTTAYVAGVDVVSCTLASFGLCTILFTSATQCFITGDVS